MNDRVILPVALMTLAGLTLGAVTAEAQEKKVGFYAGYTFLKADNGNLSGLRVSPEYRLNRVAALVGDVSAEKGTLSSSDTTLISYLVGVRFKFGTGASRVFVHGLAGGAHVSSSARLGAVTFSETATGLALDGGGGFEFSVSGAFRMRLGADYLRRRVKVPGIVLVANDLRATVGFVF